MHIEVEEVGKLVQEGMPLKDIARTLGVSRTTVSKYIHKYDLREMKINKYLYSKAFDKALKVEFLTNREELFLYAGALYSAMMWGKEIDEKIVAIHKQTSLSLK